MSKANARQGKAGEAGYKAYLNGERRLKNKLRRMLKHYRNPAAHADNQVQRDIERVARAIGKAAASEVIGDGPIQFDWNEKPFARFGGKS
jgi:hypothetical protein